MRRNDMGMDVEFQVVFQILKPACTLVSLDPNPINLNNLFQVCSSINPLILQKHFVYVYVPLAVQLLRKDGTSCNVLSCITKILEKVIIPEINTFVHVYSTVLRKLHVPGSPEAVAESSEELKLSVVKCISQLVKSSTSEVRMQFLTRENYSKLSAGVFIISEMAVQEKYVSLKLESLNSLMLLTYVSDDIPCEENFKPQLANVLMLMVPGVSTKCLQIINSNDTQNHKPIILAIRLFSRIAAIVMSNYTQEETPSTFSLQKLTLDQNGNSSTSAKVKSPKEFLNVINEMKRDDVWLKNTDQNLSFVTKMLVKCQTHHHWKVRLELASASSHLLECCGMNMAESVGYLIESLAFLSQDENTTVKNFTKECISKLGKKYDTLSGRRLVDIVVEHFYSLLTRMPRILHGADISKKEKELIVLCGFMDILGQKHIPGVLSSLPHLNRFLHCIIMCATPDCSNVTLMEEATLRGIDSNSISTEAKWRQLKLCDSQIFESALKSLCTKLMQYSDFEMLVNSLLDEFNIDPSHRKNILLLLHYMFSSGSCEEFQSYSSVMRDVLTTIMDPSLWNIPVVLHNENLSRTDIQENIVQVCLLCELVGCLSVAAGPHVFSPLLLSCLYPVLECAGSHLEIISTAGQMSLKNLAKLYEGGEVSNLVRENVDYLSHHVMLKLRQAQHNPRVLSVLTVIMEHSSIDLLPSLHLIVDDVLVQSCDMFQDINGNAFLMVFHTYLTCIKKWTVKPTTIIPTTITKTKEQNFDSIISELVAYKESLNAASFPSDEPINDFSDVSDFMQPEEPRAKPDEEVKPQLPDHIKLTKDILMRSMHFLPGNNISRQILVLEILNHGTEILSSWTDELLPVIHKIWSPLVGRFKTSNHPLLLQRAFSLLQSLAQLSRDFIRVRTAKEVLPNLLRVLKDSSEESKKKDPTGAYKLTQIFKLQRLLLSGLGKLVLDLELNFKEANLVILSCTPYLSARQPSSLQEACIGLFKKIAESFPDIVWAHITTLSPFELELKAPIDGLQTYQVETKDFNREEYKGSLQQIIDLIQ